MKLEHKSLALEIKTIGEGGTFEGYAAVFGNVDDWKDVILPGAFKKNLAAHKKNGNMPALLWQHDSRQPLGVWESFKEDSHGLLGQGRLLVDDVPKAREAWALLKARAISGLSIGYYARDYSIDEKTRVRTLKQIDLMEASLVTFPANEKAQVTSFKSSDISTIREFEAFLRDVGGFSANEAKRIAACGFKSRQETGQSAAAVIQQISKKYTEE